MLNSTYKYRAEKVTMSFEFLATGNMSYAYGQTYTHENAS